MAIIALANLKADLSKSTPGEKLTQAKGSASRVVREALDAYRAKREEELR